MMISYYKLFNQNKEDYCPACAKKIRREKSNESKRRSREQKRIACMNCPQKMTD